MFIVPLLQFWGEQVVKLAETRTDKHIHEINHSCKNKIYQINNTHA